ncbi:protein MTSS 1-like [Trematomus bernacchii]|uniref:protein MTSS 1-like n=1 Tax=Trematomus bernacchii TaxID=40690 RepID=UPI00146D9A09|nr:protein MTSS 1-like [Trematomus bernacchii]
MEKRAVCRALIEERSRYCSFVSMLKPVLDHEINMLGEVTHLQTILEDLSNLTAEPNKLPAASEQVILDLKGSDFNYSYQTPPASPSNTLSRKSSISSNYQSGSVRHVPSLDSISCEVDGVHIQDSMGSTNQLAAGGSMGTENGLLAPPQNAYTHHGERARAMSASGKSCSARDQLLTLGALGSDAQRSSRDSLHCSSGYSTQTTTPSCSEDTIHTHTVKREPPIYVDYESISLHGDLRLLAPPSLWENTNQSEHSTKSSTMPRNSDLSFQYRKFAQSKRPASNRQPIGRTGADESFRTPSSECRRPPTPPPYRRNHRQNRRIAGEPSAVGMPIPIWHPTTVPIKAGKPAARSSSSTPPQEGWVTATVHLHPESLRPSPPPPTPPTPPPHYQLVPGKCQSQCRFPPYHREGSNAKLYQQQVQEQGNQLNHYQQLQQQQLPYNNQQQQQLQQQQQQTAATTDPTAADPATGSFNPTSHRYRNNKTTISSCSNAVRFSRSNNNNNNKSHNNSTTNNNSFNRSNFNSSSSNNCRSSNNNFNSSNNNNNNSFNHNNFNSSSNNNCRSSNNNNNNSRYNGSSSSSLTPT